jgi:hypothetical protein
MDIDYLFDYRPSNSDRQVKAHQLVRQDIKTTAQFIDKMLPESPEKTLAIRKLQEALMWANAAIAYSD